MLEKSSLPALDGSFIVNVRALGCRRGDGIKLAHVLCPSVRAQFYRLRKSEYGG